MGSEDIKSDGLPDLSGKVAIVTGVGAGMGRATALQLIACNARVVAVEIDAERLGALTEKLADENSHMMPLQMSVLSTPDVKNAVERTMETWSRIDVLVNVVGSTGQDPPLENMSDEEWASVFDLNVTSGFRFIRSVLPIMKAQNYGRIINFASVAAYGLNEGSSIAYAAAKSAVIGLTKRLAREVGPHGITCNVIAPGATATEALQEVTSEWTEDQMVSFASRLPLRRFARPSEHAATVAFLASDLASYINGAVIDAGGGYYG